MARQNRSDAARLSEADPEGLALADQPVECYFCGERRKTRLVVSRVEGLGVTYRCRDRAACEARNR